MGAASMIWNPDLIHYLCIAKSTTILAHHIKNTKDSNFESLASECLRKTPPNHSFFSHTVNNLTYTFLIDPTFVIFAIFDHHLLKSHALTFLNRVRSSLIETLNQNDNFVPFSLQTQFDSVFNETLNFYDLSPNSGNEKSSPLTTLPLLGKPGEGLKKKKRLVDDGKDAALVDLSDDAVSLPFAKVNDRQKAKHKIWKSKLLQKPTKNECGGMMMWPTMKYPLCACLYKRSVLGGGQRSSVSGSRNQHMHTEHVDKMRCI